MTNRSRWQLVREAAEPRLRMAAAAAQPVGGRLVSSVDAAARRGAVQLPAQLQQRLRLRQPDMGALRRQRRRRAALAGVGTLLAGLAAAETSRHGEELRQLGGELERLREDVRALGGRRARERARRRRRRQLLAAGAGVGVVGAAAAAVLIARRLRHDSAASADVREEIERIEVTAAS